MRECAAVTTVETVKRLIRGQPNGDIVERFVYRAGTGFDRPVYASFVMVEGKWYVREMFNGDKGNGTGNDNVNGNRKRAVLLFPGLSATKVSRVRLHVGRDHVGIRCVRFFGLGSEGDDKNARTPLEEAWCAQIQMQQASSMQGVVWDCTVLEDPAGGATTRLSVSTDVSLNSCCARTLTEP